MEVGIGEYIVLTGYPLPSKNFTLRDTGVGSNSFSRDEGETNAIVSPDFRALGIIVVVIGLVLRELFLYCGV